MNAAVPLIVPDISTVQEMVAGRAAEEAAAFAQAAGLTATPAEAGAFAPPAAGPHFAFKVLSGEGLLQLPRPSWRVKGVLPECGTAVIWGPSRAGKTFAALDLALAVAKGGEWLAFKTVACDVLYICLESVWGLQGRLKAWTLEHKQEVPANVRFIIETFDLLNREHLVAVKQAAPKQGVLVIDTLNRATPGIDENSSRDMSNIINAAAEIQTAMAGLVLLVAHSGKDGARGIRGHSSLFAALDASLEVGRSGHNRFVRLDKVKEAEDGANRFFRLKPVNIGTDEDGEPITSCIVEATQSCGAESRDAGRPLTSSLQYALDSLRKAVAGERSASVHVDVWRPYFYAGHSADNDGAKKKAFQRARAALLESQKISVLNDRYSLGTEEQAGDSSTAFPAPKRDALAGQDGTHPLRGVPAVPLSRWGELRHE